MCAPVIERYGFPMGIILLIIFVVISIIDIKCVPFQKSIKSEKSHFLEYVNE